MMCDAWSNRCDTRDVAAEIIPSWRLAWSTTSKFVRTLWTTSLTRYLDAFCVAAFSSSMMSATPVAKLRKSSVSMLRHISAGWCPYLPRNATSFQMRFSYSLTSPSLPNASASAARLMP